MAPDALALRRTPDGVTRSIFTKTLWDGRRSLVVWCVAIAAVGAVYGGFWPSMNSPEMQKAIAAYPRALMEALNYDDVATAAGYVGSAVFGLLAAVLLLVFGLGAGARLVAGDEEAGTLDLVLSHPVSRTRVALERFGAVALQMALMATCLGIALVLLIGPADLEGVSAGHVAAACVQLVLFGLALTSVAFAVGAATGRRGWALGAGAAVAVVGYLANGVLPQVHALEWTRQVSPWHWYVGGEPLRHGLQPGDCALLVALTVVLVALGTWAFSRRDVGV
ncbi:MAG: ABC transporter permease subunit [Nocardioidaceae bacterium]